MSPYPYRTKPRTQLGKPPNKRIVEPDSGGTSVGVAGTARIGGVEVALALVVIAVCVIAISALANRIGMSPPLLLVIVGIGVSLLPFVPGYELSPELILIGILPPLLFSAAYDTSFIDFRSNRRPLISLSVGLVIFTTVVVGFVATWAIPGLPLAAGFALGAIVAPPDAIAATAVARRVGMPRRIVQILEGESLVNDATALTALRAAILALSGVLTVAQVMWDFVLAAAGGVIVGLIVALIYIPIRKRIKDPSIDTVLSFTIPYLAYLPAEAVEASGVLSVVVAGLLIGYKSPVILAGTARLQSEANWRTVAFLLENAVFFLIGLQLRSILTNVHTDAIPIAVVVTACVSVFAAAVITRIVWVMGEGSVRIWAMRRKGQPDVSFRALAVIGWAGMRGVVTLAAAMSLTEDVPGRDLLILVALVVVVGSILLQGSTLPWLVRRLKLRPPDPAEDALAEAVLLDTARRAGMKRLDESSTGTEPEDVLNRLRARVDERANSAWERLGLANPESETPIETYQRLRLDMLSAERQAILDARSDGKANDEAIRRVIRILDVEEALLDRPLNTFGRQSDELITPEALAETCTHLQAAAQHDDPVAGTPGACQECLEEGTTWVHLRKCLTCGHVGCCDSSPRMHATTHFRESQHAVMRSDEPGEAWRWCYVDGILG